MSLLEKKSLLKSFNGLPKMSQRGPIQLKVAQLMLSDTLRSRHDIENASSSINERK